MNRSCRYKCRNIKQKSMPTKSFEDIQMSLKHKRRPIVHIHDKNSLLKASKKRVKHKKTSLFLDF